jgi:hypothetical protein
MKNIQFLFYLFLVSNMLHGMDEKKEVIVQQNNKWNSIDYKASQKRVDDKLTDYLSSCLKSYNKVVTNHLSSQDTDQIEQMQINITNKKDLPGLGILVHRDIIDDRGYTAPHSSIEKRDMHGLKWSMGILHHSISTPNNHGKEPIDLCIDFLKPDAKAKEAYQQSAYDMLDVLTARYGEVGFDRDRRVGFLIKMMQINLEHVKEGSLFKLKDVFFTRFLNQNSVEPIEFSEVYQKARDKDGNSFTYIVVLRGLSDMLYSFAQNGYLTFTKSDSENDAVELKLAEDLFDLCDSAHNSGAHSESSSDSVSNSESSKEIDARCCCYRILLNALKQQRNDTDFELCCKNHPYPFKNK